MVRFREYPPAVVVVAGGGGGDGIDLFDAAAEGVVGEFGHRRSAGILLNFRQPVVMVVFVGIAVVVGGEVAGSVMTDGLAADAGVFVRYVIGIHYVIPCPIIERQSITQIVVGEHLVRTVNLSSFDDFVNGKIGNPHSEIHVQFLFSQRKSAAMTAALHIYNRDEYRRNTARMAVAHVYAKITAEGG